MRWQGPGRPPENARLIRDDGHEFPLDLVYEGQRDGTHLWTARSDEHPGFGTWRLAVDMVVNAATPPCDVRAEIRGVAGGPWMWSTNRGRPVRFGGPFVPASGPVRPQGGDDRG